MRILSALALLPTCALAQGKSIQVATLDIPPLGIVEQGKPSGILFEIMEEVLKKAGIPYEHTVMPVPRVYQGLTSGDVEISWILDSTEAEKITDRAAFGAEHTIACIPRKGIELKAYEDLYKYTDIGFMRGVPIGHKIDSDPKIKKLELAEFEKIIKMFQAGRMDVACVDPIFFSYYAKKSNFKPPESSRFLTLVVSKSSLVVSKKASHAGLAQKLKSAMDEVRKNKLFERILDKYGVSKM